MYALVASYFSSQMQIFIFCVIKFLLKIAIVIFDNTAILDRPYLFFKKFRR